MTVGVSCAASSHSVLCCKQHRVHKQTCKQHPETENSARDAGADEHADDDGTCSSNDPIKSFAQLLLGHFCVVFE